MKKKYTSQLSFSKSEVNRATLDLRNSGISMPLITDTEIKERFNLSSVEESFGMFGGSSDMNKFYPDINIPEDIQPKPEDFVRVPFRLLSATTVAAGSWRATDFSSEGVLKKSIKKLVKKPIYIDHDTDLMNWVGLVETTTWAEPSGKIPGGINGLLAIDAKTSPKVARGVLLGSVFSNSVTVDFEWVPSHEYDSLADFNDNVGLIHKDGKMVRRVATKIVDYFESSLVWLGADPYAKLIDADGNLVNVDESSTYNLEKESTKDSYEKDCKYSIPFGFDKHILSLSKPSEKNSGKHSDMSNNSKKGSMNKELELALKKILGLEENIELSKDHLNLLELKDETRSSQLEVFNKLKSINTQGEEIELSDVSGDSHVVLAKTEFDALTVEASKVESLEKDANVGKILLADERKEVERLYGLSVDNKKEDAIINLIEKASTDELAAFKKQYAKSSTDKFTGSCKSCGSNEFEFRSSTDGDPITNPEVKSATYEDLMEKFGSTKMNINRK